MNKRAVMNKIFLSFLLCILAVGTVYSQKLAVKSNVLYDATGTINVGGEYAINKQMSANLSLNYNGWALKQPQMWKHILVQPEFRYYLREAFNEHYAGVHLLYTTFDVERMSLPLFGFDRKHLYKNGTAYGGGVSYGYQLYITPRINLEFSVGIGFLNMKYKKLDWTYNWALPPNQWLPEQTAQNNVFLTRNYIGPTQVGISVVYIIN
jgi:long-subunit fatty acid transport protein